VPQSSPPHGFGRRVTDLIRLHLLNDPDQVGAIGEVAVVEGELWGLSLLTSLVRVLVEMIDTAGVEAAGAPLDAMHLVALLQKEFRQVAAVLPRDARDQGGFGRRRRHGWLREGVGAGVGWGPGRFASSLRFRTRPAACHQKLLTRQAHQLVLAK